MGNISILGLLDLSSAFDTTDHSILVHNHHTDFGFTNTILQCLSSYLTDRTQCVTFSDNSYVFTPTHSGVSQGSVLGPMFFPNVY